MGIKIDFVKETDKEYEEIKKLIPAASKYAFMKVDHLILVPLFQVMDIINKYDKDQEPTIKNELSSGLEKNSQKLDCISRERLKQIAFNITAEYDTETIHIDRLIDEIDNLPSVTPQPK